MVYQDITEAMGQFLVPCASVLKRVFLQNLSYKNEFDLHENELTDEIKFHNNGFARRLVLTQRQKATRKWPIYFPRSSLSYVLTLTS